MEVRTERDMRPKKKKKNIETDQIQLANQINIYLIIKFKAKVIRELTTATGHVPKVYSHSIC